VLGSNDGAAGGTAMTVKEMAPAVETRRAFWAFNSNWETERHDKFSRGREQICPCGTECWRANLRD